MHTTRSGESAWPVTGTTDLWTVKREDPAGYVAVRVADGQGIDEVDLAAAYPYGDGWDLVAELCAPPGTATAFETFQAYELRSGLRHGDPVGLDGPGILADWRRFVTDLPPGRDQGAPAPAAEPEEQAAALAAEQIATARARAAELCGQIGRALLDSFGPRDVGDRLPQPEHVQQMWLRAEAVAVWDGVEQSMRIDGLGALAAIGLARAHYAERLAVETHQSGWPFQVARWDARRGAWGEFLAATSHLG